MTEHDSIRGTFTNLRYNAWIEMGTQDADAAIASTREKLRAQLALQYPHTNFSPDSIEPIEVKVIPASWGYSPRVLVTW